MTRRPLVDQGTCVVEYDGHSDRHSITEYLVMTPDGAVQVCLSKRAAEKACRTWFRKNLPPGGAGIGKIEWRHCLGLNGITEQKAHTR